MAWANYFLKETPPVINPKILDQVVGLALKEDLGRGDLTTALTIPKNKKIQAKIIAREDFLLCGINVAKKVFLSVDPTLKFQPKIKDGKKVTRHQTLAVISGCARSILTAERVALNFLAILGAVATKTSLFVKTAANSKVKIVNTRKTIPGLRELQKYAVRIGGGYNHRFSLDEMVLIKDNHLKLVVQSLKLPKVPPGRKIEIEVESLKEFKQVLALHPDVIMLDNMKINAIRQALKLRNQITSKNPCLLEVSGGINLKNIKKYAATGVDLISVGELTDSLTAIDLSLEVI